MTPPNHEPENDTSFHSQNDSPATLALMAPAPPAGPAFLIDTHCHLTAEQFDADREAVLQRAAEAGVGAILVVADNLESSGAALALAGTHASPASGDMERATSPAVAETGLSAAATETEPALSAAAATETSHVLSAAAIDAVHAVSADADHAPTARFLPRLAATAGVHPHNAVTWDSAAAAELRALCERGVAAVGEVGLDFHYDFSPRPAQVRAFAEQGALAVELGLPLVMHCREAWPEFRAVLIGEGLGRAGGACRSASVPARTQGPGQSEGDRRSTNVTAGTQALSGCRSASVLARTDILPQSGPTAGVVHCFAGTPEQALELVAMGFVIGVGGTVTFKRNDEGREVVRALPLEAILLETDGPYLAPVPLRGRRNEPALMLHTARSVAEVRGMALEDLARATTANALRLFPALGRAG